MPTPTAAAHPQMQMQKDILLRRELASGLVVLLEAASGHAKPDQPQGLSLIHISEPTRLALI
eukprot:4051268-Alexandrium_andersonii.AAC.1